MRDCGSSCDEIKVGMSEGTKIEHAAMKRGWSAASIGSIGVLQEDGPCYGEPASEVPSATQCEEVLSES